jgi:hypothetical protein
MLYAVRLRISIFFFENKNNIVLLPFEYKLNLKKFKMNRFKKMYKYLVLFLLLICSYAAKGQDLIVTVTGDSLHCKIVYLSEQDIQFRFDEGKIITIPRSDVKSHKYNFEVASSEWKTVAKNKTVRKKETPDNTQTNFAEQPIAVRETDNPKNQLDTLINHANGDIYNPDGIEMVYVEGAGAKSSFYIGKYEVTQSQWEAVMGENPSHFKGAKNPVDNVSWDDAKIFIWKLNARTGKNYRLPTEDEWLYAAQEGNRKSNYKFAGDNSIGSVAWYVSNSKSTTHPVGQKIPNALGIYDMSGNVWEWCEDGKLRGGCWNTQSSVGVSSRIKESPKSRDKKFGFRIALSKP